jgi:hypothetical protein
VRKLRTMAIEVYKILHKDEWYMVKLPNLFKYLPSLFNTFNCLDAFYKCLKYETSNIKSEKAENYGHWGL